MRQATTSDATLQAARMRLASGQAGAAAAACHALLAANPADADARHLFGRCLAALGRLDDAAAEFQRTLALRADHYPTLVDLGVTYSVLGNHRDAQAVLMAAHAADSRPAELHFALGLCRLGLGDLAGAEEGFRAAIARNPQFPDAHNNLGLIFDRRGRLEEAVDCFRRAIAAYADSPDAHRNLGGALLRLGRAAEAAEALRTLTTLRPRDPAAHAALGVASLVLRDHDAAVRSLQLALQLEPRLADASANLGTALCEVQRLDEADEAFRRALALDPEIAEAHLGLGRTAAARGEMTAAANHLHAALARKPTDPGIVARVAVTFEESGRLLLRAGRAAEAFDCFESALGVDGARPETHLNRGHALESMGSYTRALDSFARARQLLPTYPQAAAGIASCAMRICDWPRAEAAIAELLLPQDLDCLPPFLMLALDLEPAALARAVRRRGRALEQATPVHPLAPRAHERLRLAYLSPDFRNHAVAHCIAGVLERHDRQRFHVIGVALSAADGSAIGARVAAACDEFIDASTLGAEPLVELLRAREIDVAVDLAGYTVGGRPEVFARRLAPHQVSYLGFPGSTGATYMDVVLADAIVVPPAEESLFTERVLRLPHCYLPCEGPRRMPLSRPGRAEVGLPEDAFVFCAFANGYKITQAMFAVWLALLEEIPGSVLWLRGAGPATESNLRQAAAMSGIDPGRLVFAPLVAELEQHLARLPLADLFLDTLPYNAHSTAADALWAGVPVISCRGRTFAGRVGASLLTAAGVPELICEDLTTYRRRAAELARSASALQALRAHLQASRNVAPLFDIERYTRDLETALVTLARP